MAKRKMTKEELETMSYNDIAHILLTEKKNQSTLDLFTKIVEMLELPKKVLELKIGEFYTSLTNDKRFILLDDGKWDLRVNHKTEMIMPEEDLEDYEEDTADDYDDKIDFPDEVEDEYSDGDDGDDTNEVADEYKNLIIVDEEDLEEN